MPHANSTRLSREDEILSQKLGIDFVHRVAMIHAHSGSRISWHSHAFCEVILIADGATGYEFRSSPSVHLTGGSFLIIPPYVEHRGVDEVRSPTRFSGLMLIPNCQKPMKNLPFSEEDYRTIKSSFRSPLVQTHSMGLELTGLVRNLGGAITSVYADEPFALSKLRIHVCSILIEISKRLSNKPVDEPKLLVDAAKSYMRANIFETRSIEDVAFHVGCSRAKLFKAFRDSSGLSPNDYWLRIRIENAQALLRSTNRSITQIAMECGFTTSQYFSSVFRKYTGLTPKEYRQETFPVNPDGNSILADEA